MNSNIVECRKYDTDIGLEALWCLRLSPPLIDWLIDWSNSVQRPCPHTKIPTNLQHLRYVTSARSYKMWQRNEYSQWTLRDLVNTDLTFWQHHLRYDDMVLHRFYYYYYFLSRPLEPVTYKSDCSSSIFPVNKTRYKNCPNTETAMWNKRVKTSIKAAVTLMLFGSPLKVLANHNPGP